MQQGRNLTMKLERNYQLTLPQIGDRNSKLPEIKELLAEN